MLINLNLKQKEIPDELMSIVNIPSISAEEDNFYLDNNKFLIAEKNSLPYHITINEINLMRANNNRIWFYDIEESLKQVPRGVENKILPYSKSFFGYKFIKNILYDNTHYILKFLGNNKIKEYFKLFSNNSDGFSKLSEEDLKQKEIKMISINSLGQVIAMIYKFNLIILIDIEKESKIIFNVY
jgi:hypothetical protein